MIVDTSQEIYTLVDRMLVGHAEQKPSSAVRVPKLEGEILRLPELPDAESCTRGRVGASGSGSQRPSGRAFDHLSSEHPQNLPCDTLSALAPTLHEALGLE